MNRRDRIRGCQTRRQFVLSLGLCACLLSLSRPLIADEAPVPISLQVELMLKVAAYDKNLPHRSGDRVRLVVLVKSHDADSARAAAQALNALSATEDIAGVPLDSSLLIYTDSAALTKLSSAGNLAILYLTPGFAEGEVESIASSLEGVSVLSVGALARYASQGTVLGFDLAGGKPKLLVHLGQAKKQNVDLSSSVLKLMRVVE
jgi:YfiR/HmsC-like